jgi:maltose O-acetyltransferase
MLFFLPPTRLFGIKRYLAGVAGVCLEEGVRICGQTAFIGKGRVSVGKNTWIGFRTAFYCTQLAEIRIGANCDIGPEVTFLSGSHEIGPHERRAGKGRGDDIVIGDGCWIGARVTILGGVRISSGAIIGAGAVVCSDVPSDVIYVGVPATQLRSLTNE